MKTETELLRLVPGDKVRVYDGSGNELSISSKSYAIVTVEFYSFDWSSVSACEHKPKPVEEV